MDPNFAAIQKALQDLTARFDKMDQELKTTSEHVKRIERRTIENVSDNKSRPENNTSRRAVQPNNDETNLKHIKVEAPTFDGQLNPDIFSIGPQTWTIILIGIICLMR